MIGRPAASASLKFTVVGLATVALVTWPTIVSAAHSSAVRFAILTVAPAAGPGGPAGPVGPVGPAGPVAPAGPCAPSSPLQAPNSAPATSATLKILNQFFIASPRDLPSIATSLRTSGARGLADRRARLVPALFPIRLASPGKAPSA